MGRIGLCVCSFIIVPFTIGHQVYHDWKFKEQHAKIWENIVGAKRYSRSRCFNIAGASAPVVPAIPTPLGVNCWLLRGRLQLRVLAPHHHDHDPPAFALVGDTSPKFFLSCPSTFVGPKVQLVIW